MRNEKSPRKGLAYSCVTLGLDTQIGKDTKTGHENKEVNGVEYTTSPQSVSIGHQSVGKGTPSIGINPLYLERFLRGKPMKSKTEQNNLAIEQEPTMTRETFEIWEEATKFEHEREKARMKNKIADSIRLEYLDFQEIKNGLELTDTEKIEALLLALENVFKVLKRNGIELGR